MGRLLAQLSMVALLLAAPCAAKRGKKGRAPDSVTVKPSETIDLRVDEEVDKAEAILAQLTSDNLFDSPYLVSTVYYHDGFLDAYADGRRDLDPSRRIVARISRLLSVQGKQQFITLLHERCAPAMAESDGQLALPVPDAETGRKRRRRQPHPYAVDLFVPEGTIVRSIAGGLVVLAEGEWREDDPFSTSSMRGGNCVIVFSPGGARFYRYCHLQEVTVAAGMTVEAGQPIGSVGHTGFNASRKGHGRHLHLEVNEFDGQSVRALDKNQLWTLLRSIAGGASMATIAHRRL